MSPNDLIASTRERIERAACVLRRIIGVPDYDRYVAHVNAHHPGAQPMSRDEFVKQRMIDKYSRPGGRCC
jgi:uncharacterized short protein YbdD (DUF466 family)